MVYRIFSCCLLVEFRILMVVLYVRYWLISCKFTQIFWVVLSLGRHTGKYKWCCYYVNVRLWNMCSLYDSLVTEISGVLDMNQTQWNTQPIKHLHCVMTNVFY